MSCCQFCDKNPGYLLAFNQGWVCLKCIDYYGLGCHELLGSKTCDEPATCDTDFGFWGEYNREYEFYYRYYIKPKKVKVMIEELECDPKDLSSYARLLQTQLLSQVKKVNPSKWSVEIYY